tara:strand:- start:2532 stop:2987 length:456 start_codon:yes stop_codon:yes gene_type:complete
MSIEVKNHVPSPKKKMKKMKAIKPLRKPLRKIYTYNGATNSVDTSEDLGYFLCLLITIFNPAYWFQTQRYVDSWDRALNKVLDEDEITSLDDYYAQIGRWRVWITNHPYASYTHNGSRPRRTTIVRAHHRVKAFRKQQMDKRYKELDKCYD